MFSLFKRKRTLSHAHTSDLFEQGKNYFVITDNERRNVKDIVFRPQIEQLNTSFVVSTANLDLIDSVKDLLIKRDYQIGIINLSRYEGINNSFMRSTKYDIFEQVQGVDAVNNLAKTLVRMSPAYSGIDVYFYDTVESLIAAVILLKQADNDANINSVIEFIKSAKLVTDEEKTTLKSSFDFSFERIMGSTGINSEIKSSTILEAHNYYKRFLKNSGKSRNTIVALTLKILEGYDQLADSQTSINFDMKDFTNKKFALFIVTDTSNKYLSALGRVTSQEIIYQFEREIPDTNIHFIIEDIQAYFNANFINLIENKDNFTLTSLLYYSANNFGELITHHRESVISHLEKLYNLSDVILYVGVEKTSANRCEIIINENVANQCYSGLKMYVNDANLSEEQSRQYKKGALICEPSYIYVSDDTDRMPTTHRYIIFSNHIIDNSMSGYNAYKGAYVAEKGSRFKVLGKCEYGGQTAIIMLHLPDGDAWKIYKSVEFTIDNQLYQMGIQKFIAVCQRFSNS